MDLGCGRAKPREQTWTGEFLVRVPPSLRCHLLSWPASPVHQLMVRSIASSSPSPLGVAPFYLGGEFGSTTSSFSGGGVTTPGTRSAVADIARRENGLQALV
jgi:hypothetical protein